MPASAATQIRIGEQAGRLLSEGVARRLPDGIAWVDGLNFMSDCGVDGGTEACLIPRAAEDVKASAEFEARIEFKSFLLYHERSCGSFGVEVAEAAATNGLRRLRSRFMARELHSNPAANGNPHLQESAEDKTPATIASLSNSLQGLIGAADEKGVGDLILHAPVWTLPHWLENDLVEFTGGRYLHGAFPVSFDSYPNIGPDNSPNFGPNDAPADGSGEAWLYVTGPVEFALGAVDNFTSFAGEHRQNERVAMAEQLGILRFDPCNVLAVKARVC